jgi:signal transduction histidine kinase
MLRSESRMTFVVPNSVEDRLACEFRLRNSSDSAHSPQQAARHALILVVIAGFLFPPSLLAQPTRTVRRVLIFNDFSSISSPGIAALDQAIAAGLESSQYQIELYNENLEATLFSDEASQRRFREWFIQKYADRKPDVIITVGPSSLKFMVESHERSFPNTPIVFCGTPEGMFGQSKPDSYFTGVWGVVQPEKTLIAALQLQPGTKHVVVVGGVGKFDRSVEALTKESFRKYELQLEFTYITNLDMPTLLERLRQLPSKTIVYHTSIMEDSAGAHFIDSSQAAPLVANAANAPVFVMDDVSIGHGTVGGYVLSWAADGKIAAGMAVRILDGMKPPEIPVVRNNNVYLFDWRVLRRWGLKESDLPPGSTLLFKEASVWERTKWIWISGLLIILCLSTIAAYLQFSRKQLQQARDAQLQLSGLLINAQEMERSRVAAELHDDFSQRLALLALELENVSEALPDSSEGSKQQLHQLWNSASELGADLHTVSHRLHPSSLESLGLVPGLKALCREFTSRQGIEVVFSSEHILRAVPPEVALCLFRIVQEGLQNLRKFSGASQGRVSLRKEGDRLFLCVSDEGRGFDAKDMRRRVGLGIRSMGERARLVGGQFEIHSEPGKGTRIDVSVPVQPENETAEESSLQRKTDLL